MPSGACVLRYEGARGIVWRVKYHDGDRQVMETLGREAEGWTRQKAERELGAKLAAVERGMRKPRKRTFDDLADEFVEVSLAAKPRKKSTVIDYKATIRNHLRPAFGIHELGALSRQPEVFERYAAGKLKEGRSPKSVRNDLVLLGLMFKTARRWRWVSENPLDLVDPPPLPDADTETLSAADVASVLKAYRELEATSEEEERPWYAAGQRMLTVALSTGLRRGALLGLRWQDVELLDRRLHVRQAFVRNEITTPKSKAGRRTIELGDVAISALEEQFTGSLHRAPESIVFCHPALGTPLDPSKLTKYARKALDRAGVAESFRPWHGLRHTALTETAAAGVPGIDGCQSARAALDDARKIASMWQGLLLAVGFVAVVAAGYFMTALFDLGADTDKIKAAAGAAGTIIAGGLVEFVRRQRNDARKDIERWDKLVNSRCR